MKFFKQIALLILAAGAGLALTACQPSDPNAPSVGKLSSIAITPNPVSLQVGGMQALSVIGTYTDDSTYDVSFGSSFTSSAAAVAKVSATGVVTAVASGTATITAKYTASGKTATVTVTVAPLRLISIGVTPKTIALATGSTQALTVTGTYNNASTDNVTAESTFLSDKPGVAKVGPVTGLVEAVSPGTATITATHTASGKTDTAAVTVSAGLTQLVGGIWASNYTDTPTPWKSLEGGDAGRYIDTSVATLDWWSGLAALDATPSFYFGYGINVAAKPWGFGAFVKAPGNGTADVSGYTNVKIAVWGNDQLVNTHPTFTVILKGPAVAGCTSELKGTIAVTAAGVQTYTLPLSGFTLQTACGYATAAAALAAGVSEIHVQVLGPNVQYVSGGDGSGNYPNGLNLGPISFTSGGGGGGATAPVAAAPTPPARNASDVLSVYSDAYAPIPNVNLNPPWGQTTVASEVLIANNKTQKYLTLNYQGIDWAATPINVTSMTNLHVDAWTPDVTTLKVSIISAGAENAVTLTPTLAGWNSYDIDLAQYTVPDKTAIIQLKFEGTPAGGTLYLDNLYFWKTAGGGGGGGGLVNLVNGVWASNYSETPTPWKSVEGGDAGRYIDTSVTTQDWWSGLAAGDATPSFYFGYGININAKPWGFGAFVKAPGNGTANVAGYTNVKVAVWGNDQLVNTHPTFTVILKGPAVAGCTSELKGSIAVTAAGAQTYTVPLNTFTLQTACGYATVTEALAAGVTEVHIQVLGTNVQYVSGQDAGGNYPNGLNVGPITFN
jgi:phenylpyruvate tautomerase PptA (4-oxalocrotonate tautomerase family)